MKMKLKLALWILYVFLPHVFASTPAENPISPKVGPLTLENLLKSTVAGNGMIQEAAQDIEIAKAQLDQARAALWPKASAMVLAAPIFEETGDALHSQSNWSKWGPFFKGGFEIAQPLYTFGMISSYQRAAENQIAARTELTAAKRNQVVSQAKEIYYGYLMAVEFDKLLDDLSSFLSEAVTTAEEEMRSKKKKSTVKPHDLFKLKTSLDDLEQKRLFAQQAKKTAEKALGWIGNTSFTGVAAKTLTPEKVEKKSLEDYLKLAKDSRPELKAIPSGVEARRALAEAKRAQDYPIVFLGAMGSYGWSPVRTKQDTVFANDPFNQFQGGVALGLKFDLEFSRHGAEAAEQEAEAMKLKATESYAVPGIELEVKKAFWEFEQAEGGLTVAERRRDTAKKWFVQSAMGWSIGITPAKDLLEALEGSGLARKNYIETVYSYNLSLAKLSQAIGKEISSLNY